MNYDNEPHLPTGERARHGEDAVRSSLPGRMAGLGVQQSLTDPQEGERSLVLPVDFPIDRSSTEPPRIRPLKAVEGHEHE
ncbi:MAG: hypothetical protein WDN69_01300 [Aliidongia sp.]